jgi:hypothetical protein
MIALSQRNWYNIDMKFTKGFTPWNKGTKGVMKPNKTSFKKGDNVIDLNVRFWEKVDKTVSCWLWTGSKNNMGYGRINIKGKVQLAHRISFEMNHGAIVKGLKVLHKCDNPLCVNPKHLKLGTQKENLQDMYKKGRACVGEDKPNAKLNKEKVTYIRSRYRSGGVSQRSLAKEVGISQSILCQVINKKRW